MPVESGAFWNKSQKWLEAAGLITAGLIAIFVAVVEPQPRARYAQELEHTGLGAVAGNAGPPGRMVRNLATGNRDRIARQASMRASELTPEPATEDRKLVRTSSLELIVKSPADSAEKIRRLAERLGGFLTNSEVNGSEYALNASVSIRVPAPRLEEARTEIRRLSLRVESDHFGSAGCHSRLR